MNSLIFNADMINATIALRKTHTRRLITEKHFIPALGSSKKEFVNIDELLISDSYMFFGYSSEYNNQLGELKSPYKIGETRWIRENFATLPHHDHLKPSEVPHHAEIQYLATDHQSQLNGKTRPSIFMCEWMSRMKIKIKNYWPERIQDISIEDMQKEGFKIIGSMAGDFNQYID